MVLGEKKSVVIVSHDEAIEIAELLESLEAMGGTYDQCFTKECKRAGVISKKIRSILKTK